ncbi:MAG: GNAT family N-acetyltransferase [Acidobacteria bacterium]|nr:GNAT family N-acetyltransferase [Acidobacteriota bacterium]
MLDRATKIESSATMLATQVSNTTLPAVRLQSGQEQEALAFLAERPIHTVIMAGFIRDNGLVGPLNRGDFYGYRDAQDRLKGVALIGHATLIEARVDAALAAFARVAQESPAAHMMMGEQEEIKQFWKYYAENSRRPGLMCRELLFEQRWPVEVCAPVEGLRLATKDDLKLVIPAHARMAFEETRINPLATDPMGFRMRCERRVERGRTWVWVDNDRLIFKADIVAETPEAAYLEGIYVNPEERCKGYGVRCISQLTRTLLERTTSVCLLVNEQNRRAQAMYKKAGYRLRACYDSIFSQR